MLILFGLVVVMSVFVRVSVRFLGLSRLFRGLGLWSVFFVLQSSAAVHLGVDNLGVVRHVCWSAFGWSCWLSF